MSPSRLWGWEPATVTRWAGVWWNPFSWRWVTVREPEWSRRDLELLVAMRELDAEPKNSLGTPLSESMDPANQFAYVATAVPVTDWQEAALARAQDLFYADPAHKDAPRYGHHWRAPVRKSAS